MTLTKRDTRVAAGVCILLCALIWLVFGPTLKYGFVNYDDEKHVSKNKHITPGLNTAGFVWAFTQPLASNWHPITTISHMLDCQWYGVERAGGHHLTSLLLHNAAAILLFLALRRMTGSLWQSAFVATLFAVHPLRVESVAWIAERKDVMSGFFFMLTLAAYAGYVRKPSFVRYIVVALLLALGLLSKPMLVTLPVVLLLLDYWPLGRFDKPSPNESNTALGRWLARQPALFRLVLEKIPLFVISFASSVVTMQLQKGQIDLMEDLSLPWRLGNAIVSAVIYIWQMVWPWQLAVFYPHPRTGLSTWLILLSAIFLIAVSASVVVLRRKRPYLFVGWFWYLVMLLPAIGIVQVGFQGHADRYTYLPLIGLFIAATWAIADWSFNWKGRREILIAASVVIIAVLVVQARIQTSYWRDSEVLWRHTLAVTSRNQVAHNNLATVLGRQGRLAEAAEQLKEAMQADPTASRVNYNLAGALLQAGQTEEAIVYYKKELEIEPDYANAENNLGHALLEAGRTEEAIIHFRKFVQLRPDSATAHYNLAIGLHQTRRLDEAIFQYEAALALKPDYPGARQNLDKARRENGL